MEARVSLRTHKQTFLDMFEQFRAPSGLYFNISTRPELPQNHGWTELSKKRFQNTLVSQESRQYQAAPHAVPRTSLSPHTASLLFELVPNNIFFLCSDTGHKGWLHLLTVWCLGDCGIL